MSSTIQTLFAERLRDNNALRSWVIEYRLSTQEAVLLDAVARADIATIQELYALLYGEEERCRSIITTQMNKVRKKLSDSGVKIYNIRNIGYTLPDASRTKLFSMQRVAAE